MDITRYVRDTPADPGVMPSIDITGKQRLAPHRRQRRAEWPSLLDVLEIRDAARRDFPTNDTILGARAAAQLAAADRAARKRGGPKPGVWTGPGMSLRRRWGAFLLQTGRGRLTVAQARSLRRRSMREELDTLSMVELRIIGATL